MEEPILVSNIYYRKLPAIIDLNEPSTDTELSINQFP